MRHYFHAIDGLRPVPEANLIRAAKLGGFLGHGAVQMPTGLGEPEAASLRELIGKKKNFTFWFSPDFRVVFLTKDGVIDSGGKWWKIRIEWRALDSRGLAAPSVARFDRRVPAEHVLGALGGAFQSMGAEFGKTPGPPSFGRYR